MSKNSKPKPARRRKHVAITKALVGATLTLNRLPECVTISSDDIPTIVGRLKANGLRIVRIKKRPHTAAQRKRRL